MRILIDTYGADSGSNVIVDGTILAKEKRNFTPVFVGNEKEIKENIDGRISDYEIIPTDSFISNDEDPVRAIRRKKDASIVLAYEKSKEEGYHGLVSAGSTGALLAGGLFLAGRIEGIKRACLAANIPSINDNICLLMDTGANMDCKAEYLYEFALMGSIYLENTMGIANPSIGLLNVGVEEHKGNKLSKETYALLKESKLNFVGNVESRDLFTGKVNILLADGFDGNIAIKTAEGVLKLMGSQIKSTIYKSTKNKIAGALLKNDLKAMTNKFSSDEVGGAPLLGVKSYVYKAHGNTNELAFSNAILGLMNYIERNTIEKIEGEIK
ncbi:phosphate acyltransferase PlsX [Anaerococcus urinomassiliensis]|uniref:phosphate acyltransferase PlsX n=1 Tax=Anaerococcus urinomassiliensis TaxID=1745712 RepID=UPI00093D2413|nr:phosphate acyltransferase PlsX [Anaerococcus urinomassiliensis]